MGLKEIWANKFRSTLTMIGVILGVAALVGMIGIIDGYFDSNEQWIIETGGLEKLAIMPEEPPEEQQSIAGRSPGRTMLDAEAIRAGVPLAVSVSAEVDLRGAQLQRRDRVMRIRAQGVEPDILAINNYEI
jgi:putative ABC transport system permease protein